MNLIILKNNLKEGLALVAGALKEGTGGLPVLKNVLLETYEGKLKISATDLEIGIKHTVSAKVLENGSVTVPYAVLSQIINNIPSERITIELSGNNLSITTDNYNAKIATSPKEDFPIIPGIKDQKAVISFDRVYFIDSLGTVVSACQLSDLRPELSGVFVSYKLKELKLAATDSFRLAEKTMPEKKFDVEVGENETLSLIIPLKTVQEVLRVFGTAGKSEKVQIVIEENQILFETENSQLISRLIEGKFPDYELVIPKQFETEAVIEKEDIAAALKLSSSLSNRLHEVKFFTDESLKNITISSASQEFGEGEYILPAKIKGNSVKITFNWRFVLDGLKNIKTPNVFIGLNGEERPSLLRSPDDSTYFYIIMPIKSA